MFTALIISPFATAPLDAGHRRRVFQTTRMLGEQGYRITFLLYAFEDAWRWTFQQDRFDALAAQWDEVIVYNGDAKTGASPRSGADHLLDEWWSEAFGQTLDSLFSRRFFDLLVVHNVWLSRAFDHAPRSTIKVLETHDVFSRRRPLLKAMGVTGDFYMPDEPSEMHGISRADIAVAIQEEEARHLLGRCNNQVITLPFYDPALEPPDDAPDRAGYLYPDKVVFGFLGSAHIFNVRGLQELMAELETMIGETFAPVDILVAGSASDAIRTCIPIRRLGCVPSEAAFYRHCDIAIAPAFSGTGFKIKVGDCLALRMPLLCARHSAIGTALPAHLTFDTPAQMARAMVDIALRRPALADMREAADRACLDLKRRTASGMEKFEILSRRIKIVVVMEARGLTLENGLIALYSLISCVRKIAMERPVFLILDPSVLALFDTVLPPGVRALPPGADADQLLCRLTKFVVDASGLGAEALGLSKHDVYLQDRRWDWTDRSFEPSFTGLQMPYFHQFHRWEPAAKRLRAHWMRLYPKQAGLAGGSNVVVFRDGAITGSPRPRMSLPRKFLIIDVADNALLTAGLLHILAMPEDSLDVICATSLPGIRAVISAACEQGRQRLSATIDGVFKASFPAPPLSNPTPVVPPMATGGLMGLPETDLSGTPVFGPDELTVTFPAFAELDVFRRLTHRTPLPQGRLVSLATPQRENVVLLRGWSGHERNGLWSDGTSAELELFVGHDADDGMILELFLTGYVPRADVPQHFRLSSQNRDLGAYVLSSNTPMALCLPLRNLVRRAGALRLRFSIPTAVSPTSLGLSRDGRHLGIQLNAIRLWPASVPVASDPELRISIGGMVFTPSLQEADRYVFDLPAVDGPVVLLSRASDYEDRPVARKGLTGFDRRRLGVKVERVVVTTGEQVTVIDAGDPRLVKGWWRPEQRGGRSWRWTDGSAVLPVPHGNATRIEILGVEPAFHPANVQQTPETSHATDGRLA